MYLNQCQKQLQIC